MRTESSTTPRTERVFAARDALPRHTLGSDSGLRVELWPHGGVHAIQHGDILINQWLAHPLEAGLNRLILRRRGTTIRWTELTGPASPSVFGATTAGARWQGRWEELDYAVELQLDPERALWFWRVRVTNTGASPALLDVLYGQDLGLGAVGAVRNNEAYASHYLDHAVERHPEIGPVLFTRQNQSQAAGNFPWIMQGCLTGAASFATDGFQFFGRSCKATGVPEACLAPELPSRRLQYEFAYAALQSRPCEVRPGQSVDVVFFALFESDHFAPSKHDDLGRIVAIRASARMRLGHDLATPLHPVVPSLWQQATLVESEDLSDDEVLAEFGAARRQDEREDGRLLSFFYSEGRHVALRAKELLVERSHGAILRSGRSLYPEADTLSATAYAFGVFASQVTVGNTSFHKLLSVCRNPLNLIRTCGLRLFVRDGRGWKLLGVPSAFDLGPGSCRWLYKTGGERWVVTAAISAERPELTVNIEVTQGPTHEFLFVHDLVLGVNELDEPCRVSVDTERASAEFRPAADGFAARHVPDLAFTLTVAEPATCAAMGGAELLARGAVAEAGSVPCWVIRTEPVRRFALRFGGRVGADATPAREPCAAADAIAPFLAEVLHGSHLTGGAAEIARLQETLPWYAHHALVHLTVPHGLEQFGGAAWGTRDVCQGPVEFLLALGHYAPVRQILETVYAHQYEDTAEWPQWFMFDAYRSVQQDHCHGDVIFWPLKALCDYIEASGDVTVLEARVPFTQREGFALTAATYPILEHVRRQIDRIEAMFVPGTALVSYGDGDWDDTLQPADESLRTRMVSGWTVELSYQALRGIEGIARHAGEEAMAGRAARLADAVREDFNRLVVRDGVVAGFLVFEADASVRPLLHPQDRITGIRYRLLPMTRGIISELFTPAQARAHLDLMREHLVFPDGAHLMSDPAEYRGGLSRLFKRAETSAYFGREVSLQYTHAHIRFAEALAKLGQGGELLRALLAASPVGLQHTVPNATPRQANTYFSSSDGDFADRYEAFARYGELREGRVPVKGGWRIYSSGPGIFVRQLIACWLGLRESFGDVVLDPVLDRSLDGLTWTREFHGRPLTVRYHVREREFGPSRLELNGQPLAFVRDANPYRVGGARVKRDALLAASGDLVVDVWL